MKNYKLSTKTGKILFAGFFKDYKSCLEEAVTRRIPLNHIDLNGKNLSNANLDDGMFSHADFSRCNLTGANMSECYLKETNFSGAALFNTCFAYSNLNRCNFHNASFGATDMTGAIIDGSQFSTLSTFTIDFTKLRQMKNCTFTNQHGIIANLSTPPIVIHGLGRSPVIMLDEHIFEGHRRIQTKHANTLLQSIAKLHGQVDKKYVKIN